MLPRNLWQFCQHVIEVSDVYRFVTCDCNVPLLFVMNYVVRCSMVFLSKFIAGHFMQFYAHLHQGFCACLHILVFKNALASSSTGLNQFYPNPPLYHDLINDNEKFGIWCCIAAHSYHYLPYTYLAPPCAKLPQPSANRTLPRGFQSFKWPKPCAFHLKNEKHCQLLLLSG